jgi:hypothetical protein
VAATEAGSSAKGTALPVRFSVVRLLLAGAAAGLLSLAACWTLRFGLADRWFHSGSSAAIARARQLSPGNVAYFPDPGDRAALEEARTLNPRSSSAWIRLGLLAEIDGDTARAEQLLLEAARVNRTYEPRWTLASFYFRRADREKFWFWARQALQMAYTDQSPLFLLCWQVTQDSGIILERAIPGRALVLAEYLNFLILQGKLDAAAPVGERFAAQAGAQSLPLLLSYCDRLLQDRRTAAALRIWNTLCARQILATRPLAPLQGRSLTNGDFASTPVSAGFDWRLTPAEGVSVARGGAPPELRIAFSGSQPESCQAMEQIVPLAPSRNYRLRYSYRSLGVRPQSGLLWRVTNFNGDKLWGSSPAALAGESWTEGTLTFTTPADGDLGRVVLRCDRALGSTRIEGSLWLRQVSLGFE